MLKYNHKLTYAQRSSYEKIYIYFQEINPRKHTMIFVEKSVKKTVLKSLTFSACILAWFAMGMVIAILVPDNTFAKLVLIVLWLFVFPILYYAFFYRGISIYKNKKRTQFYYCHPYSSYERGSNENQNAFIRRFLPKGTEFETISQKRIDEIADFINSYPALSGTFQTSGPDRSGSGSSSSSAWG